MAAGQGLPLAPNKSRTAIPRATSGSSSRCFLLQRSRVFHPRGSARLSPLGVGIVRSVKVFVGGSLLRIRIYGPKCGPCVKASRAPNATGSICVRPGTGIPSTHPMVPIPPRRAPRPRPRPSGRSWWKTAWRSEERPALSARKALAAQKLPPTTTCRAPIPTCTGRAAMSSGEGARIHTTTAATRAAPPAVAAMLPINSWRSVTLRSTSST